MNKEKQEAILQKLHEISEDKALSTNLLEELRDRLDSDSVIITQMADEIKELEKKKKDLEDANRKLFTRIPTEQPAEDQQPNKKTRKGVDSLFD